MDGREAAAIPATTKTTLTGTLSLTTVNGDGKQFVGRSGSGHTLIVDTHRGNAGPTPVELLVLAVGACTAMDVIGILRKKRQQVSSYEVAVSAEQRDEYPKIFTKITIHHVLRGVVTKEAVERALRLSEDKYCAVGAMLGRAAAIETSYEILAPADERGR